MNSNHTIIHINDSFNHHAFSDGFIFFKSLNSLITEEQLVKIFKKLK